MKSKLPLAERQLSCHHHVNDLSHSHHASRSVCHCPQALTATLSIVICIKKKTSIESAADLWTWDGVILWACVDHVDHNYLLYWSVDYDDCLAQFSSTEKEEERQQAVLGLLAGAKGCCNGSSHAFWEKFNLAVVCGNETQTNYITITKYYQWSSWSNERSWHFSHCITLPQNHEVMRTFNLFFKIWKLSSLCSLSWKLALIKKIQLGCF